MSELRIWKVCVWVCAALGVVSCSGEPAASSPDEASAPTTMRPDEPVPPTTPEEPTAPACIDACVARASTLAFGRYADFSIEAARWGNDGAKYIVGTYEDSFSLDGENVTSSDETPRGFLLRFSEAVDWFYQVDSPEGLGSGLTAMTIAPTGEIVVGGLADYNGASSNATSDRISLFLAKFASDGTEVWDQRHPLNATPSNYVNQSIRDLQVGDDGTIWATGDLEPGGFLAKHTADGTLEWILPLDGTKPTYRLLHAASASYVSFAVENALVVTRISDEAVVDWRTEIPVNDAKPLRLLENPEGGLSVFFNGGDGSSEARLQMDTGEISANEILIDAVTLTHVTPDPQGGFVLAGSTTSPELTAFGTKDKVEPWRDGVQNVFSVGTTAAYEGKWSLFATGGRTDAHVRGLDVHQSGHVLMVGDVQSDNAAPYFEVRGQTLSAPRLGYVLVLDPTAL
jgi:hypothetical protein